MLYLKGFERTRTLGLHVEVFVLSQAYAQVLVQRFDSFIVSLGCKRLCSNHCPNYNRFDENAFIILLLYVDNMLVVGRIQKLKAQLARKFDLKVFRPTNKILGMQYHRDKKDRKV